MEGGWPGHARLFEPGSVILHGPVAAQVALGVGVIALLDANVGPRLSP